MNDGILKNLNEIFQNRARLGIMTVLTSYGDSTFKFLKSQLQLTDGNLSAHMQVLEKASYIKIEKKFIGKKPQTSCKITEKGYKAFLTYLEQLEEIIRMVQKNQKNDNLKQT